MTIRSRQPSKTAMMMMTMMLVSVLVSSIRATGVMSVKLTVTGTVTILGGASLSVATAKKVYSV